MPAIRSRAPRRGRAERGLEVLARGREVALLGGQDAGAVDGVHAQLRRAAVELQRGLGERAALGDVPARGPVVRARDGQPQRGVGVAERDRVPQGRAQVVVVGVEPRLPGRHVRAAHALVGAVEEPRERARVAVAHVVAARELLERELAHRLEHQEALPVAAEQAVIGERGDAVERIGPQTSSAASSVKPPAKTPSRANRRCASGSSSS